ncbi:MAG: FxLYD domain-containing protein [Candidatus Levybacteria bacterium]|nr:FxLYD domain-containing protein [Candidatus Levybacteria bacterium]
MTFFKGKIIKFLSGFNLINLLNKNIKSLILKIFFLVFVIFLFVKALSFGFSFISAQTPTISLQFPKEGEATTGEKTFIRGIVNPPSSDVFANGQKVAKNGDGSFTAVISIPEGTSTFKMEAKYRGKKSEVLRLITRQLTQEELQKKEDDKKKKELIARENVLKTDQKIGDILSAYDKGGGAINAVTVLENKLDEKSGFQTVTGKVINNTNEKAYWVKVTADFYDANNNIIDTKSGFAVSLDDVLEPGRATNFKTQSTTTQFSYYKVSVDWKTNSALGGADGNQNENNQASPSSKPLRIIP